MNVYCFILLYIFCVYVYTLIDLMYFFYCCVLFVLLYDEWCNFNARTYCWCKLPLLKLNKIKIKLNILPEHRKIIWRSPVIRMLVTWLLDHFYHFSNNIRLLIHAPLYSSDKTHTDEYVLGYRGATGALREQENLLLLFPAMDKQPRWLSLPFLYNSTFREVSHLENRHTYYFFFFFFFFFFLGGGGGSWNERIV